MEAGAVQKSMEMAMSICRRESEDEQTMKKKKRNELIDRFFFLPDDILSDILKRLPDTFLCYKAKYVCRRWFDVIGDRILVDQVASFILQETGNLMARHVCIREEEEEGQGLQVKEQYLDIPSIGIIRSWSNEFLLISDYKKRSLYAYNLITKEEAYLPEYNAPCGGYCTTKCGVAISFDGFIYKVVHLFMGPPIECHILTLGIDFVSSKWKKIQAPNCMDGGHLYSFNPVSIQGRYIHWEVNCDKRLVSMDMVKEEIVDMSLPLHGSVFVLGGSLALFAGDTWEKAEIWILKDFQMMKWERLQSVTIEKWYYRRYMSSNRYIILECKDYKGMGYYDLKSGVLKKLHIQIEVDDCCVVQSSPQVLNNLATYVKDGGRGGNVLLPL